jgi:hypothetical protein
MLNTWWEDGKIPEEALRARVVMIYKKGDTSKNENYRPISLLNAMYKIMGAILHRRIEKVLDPHLQKTQFGFRKKRSTADAIYLIRRVAEFGERTKDDILMVLLDWEKAFDKVDRRGMFVALERMGVSDKLIRGVKNLYSKTEFMVEIEGDRSEWKESLTGIRQGCPLSPSLFLVVMTVMFHDIKSRMGDLTLSQRIPGMEFDEVLYADDTICIATEPEVMNRMLKEIEEEGEKYGMKLNKGKCELLHKKGGIKIKLRDGTEVTRKNEVKYLGCELNADCKIRRELGKRMAVAVQTLKNWICFGCTATAILFPSSLLILQSAFSSHPRYLTSFLRVTSVPSLNFILIPPFLCSNSHFPLLSFMPYFSPSSSISFNILFITSGSVAMQIVSSAYNTSSNSIPGIL